jgi:hypothetical protein
LEAPRAEGLRLLDPATGMPLSPLRSWPAIAAMLSGTTFVGLVVAAIAPVMHAIAKHFGQEGQGDLVAYGIIVGAVFLAGAALDAVRGKASEVAKA